MLYASATISAPRNGTLTIRQVMESSPLPAVTGTARSARGEPRDIGCKPARANCCRWTTTT